MTDKETKNLEHELHERQQKNAVAIAVGQKMCRDSGLRGQCARGHLGDFGSKCICGCYITIPIKPRKSKA